MKKTYSFLTALLSLMLAALTPALADDNITFEVTQSTGFWTKWNNNAGNPWASQWQSTQEDPQITITHTNNNMRFWDGTNITFFSHIGSGSNGQTYRFTVSTGYNIVAMSLDFACSNGQGVSVSLNGEEAVENNSTEDFEHVEVTDIETTECTMTVTSLGDASTFANTKNLVLTLARQSQIEVAEAEFMEILHKYETMEEDDFQVGTAPGLYTQEARDAFFEALAAGLAIDDIPADQLTEEKYKELGDNIVAAYEALVASRNLTYTLPEGYKYFRVRAGMTYVNDGEDAVKYLYTVRSGEEYIGYWASPTDEDPLDDIQRLWLITPSLNNFDMVNVYAGGRFNNIVTSTTTSINPESDNLMAFDPVYTDEDGVTFINIRVATQDPNKTLYLHQGGHGGGTGTQGTIVGWSSTWTYFDGPKATEWVLEPVSDEEAAAIIEKGSDAIAREKFEDDFTNLAYEANITLAAAQADLNTTDLITSDEQITSPWSDSDEGLDFGALIDNDPATYWHSDWHAGNVEPMTHYLQVELNEPTHDLVRIKVTRRPVTNDHITSWVVAGSNDPEADDADWTQLALLATPFASNTETVTTRGFNTKGFKHLRLYIAKTTTGRGYGHASELQLQAIDATQNTQYAAIKDAADALTAKLGELEFTPVEAITEAQGAELQTAYQNFRKVYIDPTDLRDLIAKAEELAEGIVVGTQPGYWSNDNLGTALKAIVERAKAYDEAGTYTAEQSNAFIAELNEAMAPVLDAAIAIKTGKWYNIRFGSEATFEENGWDLVAGEAVMSEAEEGEEPYQVDEPLWDKIITAAKYSSNDDGVHYVLPIEAEDVRLGNNLFVDDKQDIETPDMALFRFVAVGDTAYVIQNKATGLFIHTGVTGAATLSIHPSLFNVSAIGFGQNIIQAKDLKGVSNNNLHIQRSYNMVVTWDADTPGSRSGLYLDEVADVAADYDGTKFAIDIREGQIYTFCYPVDLSLDEANSGEMWTVNAVEGSTVKLAKLQKVNAGRPFIYIAGETDAYDAEADTQPEFFRHGYTYAPDPETEGLFRGTYTTITPGAGFLIVNESKRNSLIVSHAMMENSTVGAYQGYIAPAEGVSGEIEIQLTNEEDGIQTAIANVSRTGAIYTIDGRYVGRGNLNTVSRLAPGIYIVNGIKLAVK